MTETVLRIATFNLESLDVPAGHEAPLADRVRALRPQFLRMRADVLCLQEVNGQRTSKNAERSLTALDHLIADTEYEGYHRVHTRSMSRGGPRDRHNLVILSRLPLLDHGQLRHDLVEAPRHRFATAEPDAGAQPVEWDRPVLHAKLDIGGGRALSVINLHLRAPRAAFVPGHKIGPWEWEDVPGWAEGLFLAAVKGAGQAFEARLYIDRLFDAEPDALIAVCGDFNAGLRDIPGRIIRADEEDMGSGALAARCLVALERSLPKDRRYSVVHRGRPEMVDHILISRALLAWYRDAEIHNEPLGDEVITPAAVHAAPSSFHAPVVAEFRIPDLAP